MRGDLQAEVERINRGRLAKARSVLQQAQRALRAGGWNVHLELTSGAPLSDLMDIVTNTRADVLVVGARGCTAIDRLVLGSVAEGALNRSPVPVLVVP
jgi:nucleotide-binding universal stress UspA family protein